jgi:hypothetical protein
MVAVMTTEVLAFRLQAFVQSPPWAVMFQLTWMQRVGIVERNLDPALDQT